MKCHEELKMEQVSTCNETKKFSMSRRFKTARTKRHEYTRYSAICIHFRSLQTTSLKAVFNLPSDLTCSSSCLYPTAPPPPQNSVCISCLFHHVYVQVTRNTAYSLFHGQRYRSTTDIKSAVKFCVIYDIFARCKP
jgi:hypothetical protein